MKKILLLTSILLTYYFSNAQFSTGEVTLSNTTGLEMHAIIETQPAEVTLTLTGPGDRWFAIGFGGLGMSSVSDVFVYDGTGNFDKTGQPYAAPSNDTNQDWTILSETTIGSSLKIVATRSLSTTDSNDYTFINNNSSISIIWARGAVASTALNYHGERSYTTLSRNATADINTLEKLQFSMYPNPVKEELNLVLPSNIDNAEVKIYTVLGKIIKIKNLNTAFNKLNISNLTSGIYLIKITGNNNTFGVKRFVKK